MPSRMLLAVITILIVDSDSRAQQILPPAMTISQAVESASKHYPSVVVSQEQVNAAAAAIDLARTAYLPRVDSLAQINRATRNNVFGLLLPQGTIPSLSGPVLGTNTMESVWGSAVGVLGTWEPFDFGLRGASVSAAGAAKTRSEASLRRTEFDVAVATADAYLTLMAAQETVRAAQAGVDRGAALRSAIRAQVDAQLRPGADASRAEAELALARTQLARAEQAAGAARAVLSQFTGVEPARLSLAAPNLAQLPPDTAITPLNAVRNPVVAEQNAMVEQKKAELQILRKSYFPRFFFQGSAYGRGTGALADGTRLGGASGLTPDTRNFAVGLSVTFPIFDLPTIHAREAGQSAAIRAESARSEQIAVDLKARWDAAVATLAGSRQISANTPVQVSAASATVQQATARYQAGLGTIVEVADAQRLLTQSEIDDALARLGVWRAILGVAAAAGDIQPFLTTASQ